MSYRKISFSVALVLAGSTGSCRDSGGTQCGQDDKCAGGFVCIDSACRTVCHNDGDCAQDSICTNGVCWPNGAPRLNKVYGNGTASCASSPQDLCFIDGLIVQGHNLHAAAFRLQNGDQSYALTSLEQTTGHALVQLPADLQ